MASDDCDDKDEVGYRGVEPVCLWTGAARAARKAEPADPPRLTVVQGDAPDGILCW